MNKRLFAVIFAVILVFSAALIPASAEASYIYKLDDSADLLTAVEEQQLTETLAQVCEKCKCNVIFFTAEDLSGTDFSHLNTAQDYTQRYYETVCGVNTDGVVCSVILKDEDGDRQISLYGSGNCVRRLTDSESENIRDNAISDFKRVSSGSSESSGYYELLDSVAKGVAKAVPRHLKWYMIPLSVVIGFVIALLIMSVFKKQLKTVRMERGAVNYVRPGSMQVTASRDTYLYSSVSRVAKPKDSGGGGSSHSSGGGSYSGGGSKF